MKQIFAISVIFLFTLCTSNSDTSVEAKESHTLQIVDGVHPESGLKDDIFLPIIITNCTACHSAKLVTQNRATREGWANMIAWMQQTQNLWELGDQEKIILDYLEKNYSPENPLSRRGNLEVDWYDYGEVGD